MARLTRAGGKTVQRTRDQLLVIREQGQKERNSSIREMEAKQKAVEATADNETTNETQCPEGTTTLPSSTPRQLRSRSSVLIWAEETPLRTSSCNLLGIQEPMSYLSRNPRPNKRTASGSPNRISDSIGICLPVLLPTLQGRAPSSTRKSGSIANSKQSVRHHQISPQ